MNASNFGIKVVVESNVPQSAFFDIAVVICWHRHNTRQSRITSIQFIIIIVFLFLSFTVCGI